MNDDQLASFSTAYQQLIIRGLGPSFTRQALGFEEFVRDQRVQAQSVQAFARIKNLLGRALVNLSRTAEFRHLIPYLRVWQLKINQADSPTKLGLLCLQFAEMLFPASKVNLS